MNCGCESLACVKVHKTAFCPVKTDENSPTMLYVGKICDGCATRISDNGGARFITDKEDKS